MPVLDIVAGFWNFNSGNTTTAEWKLAYRTEIFSGIVSLFSWAFYFQQNPTYMNWFLIYSRIYVIVEAVNLFLVYAAEESWPNNLNQSTNFAYFVHIFGLITSLVWMIMVNNLNVMITPESMEMDVNNYRVNAEF